jgi:hypothetical protein
MGKQRKVTRLVAVVAMALVLVVLGIRLFAVPAFENSPDHVHVVVTSVRSLASCTPLTVIFDHQVTQEASAIYQQLTAGTDVTDKAISCPAAPLSLAYYHYVLTFSRSGTMVATATDDALGCGEFTVERLDGSTAYLLWTGDQERCFWDYLHERVNAPEPIHLDTCTLCSAASASRSASGCNWTEH